MNDLYHGDEPEIKQDYDSLCTFKEIERQHEHEIANEKIENFFNNQELNAIEPDFISNDKIVQMAREIQDSLRIIWG